MSAPPACRYRKSQSWIVPFSRPTDASLTRNQQCNTWRCPSRYRCPVSRSRCRNPRISSKSKPRQKTALPGRTRPRAAKDGYINAIQVYPYTRGALYQLYAAVNQVADIALEPGEKLVSVSAGDTVRWVVGDASSGEGKEARKSMSWSNRSVPT